MDWVKPSMLHVKGYSMMGWRTSLVTKRQTFLSGVVVESHFLPRRCWAHSDKLGEVFPALSQLIVYRGEAGDRQANESVLMKQRELTGAGGGRPRP